MTISDRVGDTLRKAMPVPTDTMITLDLPLLLTKLSRVPATDRTEADAADPSDRPAATDIP